MTHNCSCGCSTPTTQIPSGALVQEYETVADMTSDEGLQVGYARTLGFYVPGDGGGAEYKVRTYGTPNGMDVLQGIKYICTAFVKTTASPIAYGVLPSTDISAMLTSLNSSVTTLDLSGRTYIVSSATIKHSLSIVNGTLIVNPLQNTSQSITLNYGLDFSLINVELTCEGDESPYSGDEKAYTLIRGLTTGQKTVKIIDSKLLIDFKSGSGAVTFVYPKEFIVINSTLINRCTYNAGGCYTAVNCEQCICENTTITSSSCDELFSVHGTSPTVSIKNSSLHSTGGFSSNGLTKSTLGIVISGSETINLTIDSSELWMDEGRYTNYLTLICNNPVYTTLSNTNIDVKANTNFLIAIASSGLIPPSFITMTNCNVNYSGNTLFSSLNNSVVNSNITCREIFYDNDVRQTNYCSLSLISSIVKGLDNIARYNYNTGYLIYVVGNILNTDTFTKGSYPSPILQGVSETVSNNIVGA